MAERVCIISYLPNFRGAFGSLRRQMLDVRYSMIAEGSGDGERGLGRGSAAQ
jgi:hypothetical protein